MPTTSKEVAPLEELNSIGRTLQNAGLTLLQAASNAVGALAKDTLTATNVVIIAAAEDTLDAAREKLRKIREGNDVMIGAVILGLIGLAALLRITGDQRGGP